MSQRVGLSEAVVELFGFEHLGHERWNAERLGRAAWNIGMDQM